MKRITLGLMAFLTLTTAHAAPEPLPAKEAFQASLLRHDANTLVVDFNLPQGYFLYKKKLAVLDVAGFEVSDMQVTGVKQIDDPQLGVSDVLDGSSYLVLRGRNMTAGQTINLRLKMQGCLKDQVCYQPEVRTLQAR